MSFGSELQRRSVFKVSAAYAVMAWLLIQIASAVFPQLGLPDWSPTLVTVLLMLGFPVALILAWAYELRPTGIRLDTQPPNVAGAATTKGKSSYLIGAVFVVVAAAAASFWLLDRNSDAAWVRAEAVPEIERLADVGDWERAFALARQAEERQTDDRVLATLWSKFSWLVTVPSDPQGATVYRRPYASSEDDWERLGITPLENIRIPFGLSELRFELEGYRTTLRTLGGGAIAATVLEPRAGVHVGSITPDDFKLDAAESLPVGMVRVPGWTQSVAGEETEFADFFIGRFEVTNRDYKRFVDAGGYLRREYWVHDFVDDGEELSWDEAMERFVDRTGRPGPGTWEGGDYPNGRADYPVTGVSWYEAAAYARFAGEGLPTAHHWVRAYSQATLAWLLPVSNVEGEDLAPVGEFKGMSWPGTFDMAGNAREWTFNASGNGRVILGGGWNDPIYIPQNLVYAQPPMAREPMNGFRLARSQDGTAVRDRAERPLPVTVTRDVLSEERVPGDVIRAYQVAFSYDATPLNARVEASEPARGWTRERISFDAAYGDERMVVYLFLPESALAPYKTVVYWPGSNALGQNSIDDYPEGYIDFVIKSGRAVAFPVLDGTFERGDRQPQPDSATTAHRERTVRRIKDFRRTIDYLETRSDLDTSTLAYSGLSWGGWNAPTILAVEPRLRSAVLYVAYIMQLSGGAWSSSRPNARMLPEVDPVTYLPEVEVPVLMLNGEFDNMAPLETSVRPFFELLGTPPLQKRHVVAKGDHFVPRVVLIRETLDWLDEYQGLPARTGP